jgi:fructoselysine-6-P-deglycase FrlB-like protein
MDIASFIEEQPDVIRKTLGTVGTALSEWRPGTFDGVLLVGSGSSLNALTVVLPLLHAAGLGGARVIGPGSFLSEARAGYQGTPLVVVLSQSGASTTSIAAARLAGLSGWPTLVVTGEADSPIASAGPRTIVLPIGAERVGPKTKGYTASLAAVLALAVKLGGSSLPSFDRDAFAERVAAAAGAAERLAAGLDAADHIVITGSRRFFGIALEASLKISEIAGVPSAAYELEELLHGRLHGLTSRSVGVIVAAEPDELSTAARAAEVMRARHVDLRILNATGVATPFDWPIAGVWQAAPLDVLDAVVPFQWLAVRLALRRGMVPEAMRYPGLSKALAIKVPDRA